MSQILVQHAHALVAIAAEAEEHVYHRGAPGSSKKKYTAAYVGESGAANDAYNEVYSRVVACCTQAVKAVAHLTDHLIDSALDEVAGAKSRFATQFATKFQETFGLTVQEAWRSGAVKHCPDGITAPYTVHATPVRPSFTAHASLGDSMLLCSRATFNSHSRGAENSTVVEYIVVGIEKTASELAADLALFVSGTAAVLKLCKQNKHVQAEKLLLAIKKDWELSIALQVGTESFYITPLHDDAFDVGAGGGANSESMHTRMPVEPSRDTHDARTPEGAGSDVSTTAAHHGRPKEVRRLQFEQFKTPEKKQQTVTKTTSSKVAAVALAERTISKRLSFARHKHVDTASASAANKSSASSIATSPSTSTSTRSTTAVIATPLAQTPAPTPTPARVATPKATTTTTTAAAATPEQEPVLSTLEAKARERLIAGLTEIFYTTDVADHECHTEGKKHRRGSTVNYLDKTELRFRLDKDKFEQLLRDTNAYHVFDKDGDGNVSVDEILDACDNDNDGQISLEEFLTAAHL